MRSERNKYLDLVEDFKMQIDEAINITVHDFNKFTSQLNSKSAIIQEEESKNENVINELFKNLHSSWKNIRIRWR
jgi:hypothetical protein